MVRVLGLMTTVVSVSLDMMYSCLVMPAASASRVTASFSSGVALKAIVLLRFLLSLEQGIRDHLLSIR